MLAVLRVGARDQHAAVQQRDGLAVVQARHRRVGHDGHALADGARRVVKHGVVVGVVGEAEPGHAHVRAVQDEVRPVGERRHAADDALGRHALQRPGRVRRVGLDADAVVQRGVARGRAAADEDPQGVAVRGVLR